MLKFSAAGDSDAEEDSFDFGYETDLTVLSPRESTTENIQDVASNSATSHPQADQSLFIKNGQITLLADLHTAVINGSLPLVANILAGDPTMCNKLLGSGWTALMYASNFGKLEIVQKLLEIGADVNVCGPSGCSALMAACKSSCPEKLVCNIVELLLKFNADVTKQDNAGRTALIYAARGGKCEIVNVLLGHDKIDLNSKDKQGWNAADWAIYRNYMEVVKCLANKGPLHINVNQEAISTEIKKILKETNNWLESKIDTDESTCEKDRNLETTNVKPNEEGNTEIPEEPILLENIEENTQNYEKYGQLELLLCGLDLPHLIPLFHEHDIRFDQLLDFTMEDLNIIGIKQHGSKLRILKAVRDWHCQEWKEESLPDLAHSGITFKNVQAVLKSSKDHLQFISRSLGFIQKQLIIHPQLLAPAANMHYEKDPHCHVLQQVEEIVLTTHGLCSSLKCLHVAVKNIPKKAFENNLQLNQADHISKATTKTNYALFFVLTALFSFQVIKSVL
uniref:Ankyrin repeat, SAM and basic leucine zipper domain-containing protein 1 n=1 Tax=Phallusia mammillata TaxID=59560 RepID=A0A6F9D7M5_9ASCI|nr:ankyrin repeat, SAM and basic leucine zipper domain-containing protein 1 [Phallusia mammillata]